MRVVFMGFQTWGLVSLRAIVESGHDVPLVVTHPADLEQYSVSFDESVEDYALTRRIPVIVSRRSEDPSVLEAIRQAHANIIVASNWRRYIPKDIIRDVPNGAINIHRSLLPRYGGFAPINWAIINGEAETGVTIHIVAEEFDLGDIVLQERCAIGPDETATEVFHKTTPLITRMIPEALRQFAAETATHTPQDPNRATFFHGRSERDNLISWHKPRSQVYNLIRAQSDPFPNAFTYLKGNRLMVKSAELSKFCYCGTPGRIVRRIPGGVVVLCGGDNQGNQGLILRTVAGPDGQTLVADQYFSKPGDYLGD